MKNKVKILLTTLVIFSCFLINIKGANAWLGETSEYAFISPINPFNNNGDPESLNVNIHAHVKYKAGVEENVILWWDWDVDAEQDTIPFTGSYAKYYLLGYLGGSEGVKFAHLGWGFDKKNPVYSNNDYVIPKGPTDMISIDEGARPIDQAIRSGEADYIKVKVNSDFSLSISKSNAEEYGKFIENQFNMTKRNVSSSDRNIGTWNLISSETNLNLIAGALYNTSYDISSVCYGTDDKTNKGKIFDPHGDSCLYPIADSSSFIEGSEFVLVSTRRKQKYSSTYFDRLKETMEKYSIKHWGEEKGREKFERAFANLDQIMDTGEYDTRTYSDVYYKKTKSKMYDYMINYINSGTFVDSVENVSKNHFTNWLDLNARYVLEDGANGVKTFKQYFNFMYADPSSKDPETGDYTKPRTSTSPYSIVLDEESYEIILQSINDMIGLKDQFDAKDALDKEPCNVYCPMCFESESRNSQACLQCQNSSNNFKTCVSCRKKATDSCKGAPDVCFNGTFDSCLNENIGNGASKYYHDSVQQAYEKIGTDTEGLVVDMVKNLEKLNLYDFADIRWKPYKYNGDCSDVVILRWVWLIITIGAPFLVIILGSIDYFKNVVFSKTSLELEVDPKAYEREWSTNKRKFVRRLVALLVLIALPIIIKLIIGNLAPKDSSASNLKLLNCIVNGK